jgi:hypothetical protein
MLQLLDRWGTGVDQRNVFMPPQGSRSIYRTGLTHLMHADGLSLHRSPIGDSCAEKHPSGRRASSNCFSLSEHALAVRNAVLRPVRGQAHRPAMLSFHHLTHSNHPCPFIRSSGDSSLVGLSVKLGEDGSWPGTQGRGDESRLLKGLVLQHRQARVMTFYHILSFRVGN